VNGRFEVFLVEPLAPEVKEQHFGKEFFVGAPPAIRFANRDENFHYQGAMQIVHELDESAPRLRKLIGKISHALLASRQIKFAALAQKLAKLARQIRKLKCHVPHYPLAERADKAANVP
jgi:hypothetical protein